MAYGQFHSVLTNAGLPQGNTGTVGDVWFVNATGLIWFVVGDGSLVQLLASVPIPTIGATGPTGPQGVPGSNFIGTVGFFGTWSASPTSYQAGAIVSFNGFLYMSKAILNISDNTMAPAGNPFWLLLGAVNTTRSSEIVCCIDGAGVLPGTGFKGFINIPFSGTLTGWVLLADQSGSAVVTVKYATYANLPSTVDITGGSPPTLTTAQKAEGNVSAWTVTSVNAGDVLEFDLQSVSGSLTFITCRIQISALN
jgi:hypothetical protein